MKRLKKFLDKPRTPLVVDRRFDIYFILMWFIYVSWAVGTSIQKLPSMNSMADNVYEFMWSGAIGTSALVAMIFAILGFIPTLMPRVAKEKIEMYAVIILSGFIFVYPCVILYNVAVLDNVSIAAAFTLSFSYLLTPLYRIAHLWGRIKSNV